MRASVTTEYVCLWGVNLVNADLLAKNRGLRTREAVVSSDGRLSFVPVAPCVTPGGGGGGGATPGCPSESMVSSAGGAAV